MSTATYTYNNCDGSQPQIDFPRVLIPDTGGQSGLPNNGFVYSDQEILAFAQINSLQWQSGMFWSGPAGVASYPVPPSNYLRTAALALNSLAGNSARILAISQLLDVKMQPVQQVVAAMQAVARRYLEMDDNSGAVAIAEQVQTSWNFINRYWSQVQRQSGGFAG